MHLLGMLHLCNDLRSFAQMVELLPHGCARVIRRPRAAGYDLQRLLVLGTRLRLGVRNPGSLIIRAQVSPFQLA